MKSMKAIIGRTVLKDGKHIGYVKSVELDHAMTRMIALYVDGGLTGMRRIASEHVRLIGEVSVMVDDLGKRAQPKEAKVRRARTLDGARAGAVTGALLDVSTLDVAVVELSRGYLDDLFSGRQWVFHYAVNKTNGEVLIESEGGKQQ